jgi:hypothetical protein
LNITFDGFCYLGDGSLSNSNVRYQAYFYRVNAGSTPSKWNAVRLVEPTGYYSLNLGDGDFLTQDGSANNNDRVVVVFWRTPGNRLDNCSLIQEWGAFELTLAGGAVVYTRQAQVKPNILPNLVWTFPTDGLVGTSYSSTNGSNDEHSWSWMSNTMNHWYTRYSQTIYSVNKVNNTDYDWDDGNQSNNLGGSAIGSHVWAAAGDYTIQIVIEDECGDTVTGTKNIRITYPPPVPNLVCHQANVSNQVEIPDTVVTFGYTGSDPNSRITGIDWVIADATSTSTNGASVGSVVSHTNGLGTDWYNHLASAGAFTNPGVHNVAIVVHWHDGFDSQVVYYNENFTQLRFSGPDVDFSQDPIEALVTSGVVFSNTSTDTIRVGTGFGPPNGVQYDWRWNDDGAITQINNVGYSYELTQTPTSDNCSVQLCAHWQDGWDEQITCIEKDVIFAVSIVLEKNDCYYDLTVYGTSDDGSVSGYHWEISRSTSSGTGGPWEPIWTSPEATNQKYKTICFTEINYFLIEAFVHGNGPTASAQLEFLSNEVCAEECAVTLWNGTGFEDSGGDWNHNGHGVERMYAKYEGTNGLDATNFNAIQTIKFTSSVDVNVDQYDLLSMYMNLKEWQVNKDISVYFDIGNAVNLSAYIDKTKLNEWQRVLIPFEDFGFVAPINLNKLTLNPNGNMGFYLDNVMVTVGAVTTKVIAIEKPRMSAESQDTPITRARGIDYRPGMSAFPPPGNL